MQHFIRRTVTADSSLGPIVRSATGYQSWLQCHIWLSVCGLGLKVPIIKRVVGYSYAIGVNTVPVTHLFRWITNVPHRDQSSARFMIAILHQYQT